MKAPAPSPLVERLLRDMAQNCRVWQDGKLVDLNGDGRPHARWSGAPLIVSRAVGVAVKGGWLMQVRREWLMTQKAREWLLADYRKWHKNPDGAIQELLFAPLELPADLLRVAQRVREVPGIGRVVPSVYKQMWELMVTWAIWNRVDREDAQLRVYHITDSARVIFVEPPDGSRHG